MTNSDTLDLNIKKYIKILFGALLFIGALLVAVGYMSEHGYIDNHETNASSYKTLSTLPKLLGNETKWSIKSRTGFSALFYQLTLEDLKTNEKTKNIPEEFLRKISIKIGSCITNQIREFQDNPKILLENINMENESTLIKIRELKDSCVNTVLKEHNNIINSTGMSDGLKRRPKLMTASY